MVKPQTLMKSCYCYVIKPLKGHGNTRHFIKPGKRERERENGRENERERKAERE